ncbi:ATPase [Paecilomyces lecythidis]
MSDGDSAFESIDGANSTSISSSVFHYKYENGRRYHAYREGAYLLPNDDIEQNRLDLGHHIFRLVLGGYLYRAPITQTPQRVLDFGTGTGIWAIDMADEFPSALIIGTDLSPIQPTWVPPNCRFYVDDVESDWTFPPDQKFDFIHGRGMAGGIGNWSRLYQQAYEHLAPGGWIEMQEYESEAHSDDGTLETTRFIRNWQNMINEASTKAGKNFNEAPSQKQRLIDAGFVDVRDDIYKVRALTTLSFGTLIIECTVLTTRIIYRCHLAPGPKISN